MPSNPETAQSAAAPPSAFAQVRDAFFGIAGTTATALLKQWGEGELTQMQARQQIDVQRLYDREGLTNDENDANRQAVEQTELMFGFLPVPKGAKTAATWAFVIVGILVVVVIIKSIAKR